MDDRPRYMRCGTCTVARQGDSWTFWFSFHCPVHGDAAEIIAEYEQLAHLKGQLDRHAAMAARVQEIVERKS